MHCMSFTSDYNNSVLTDVDVCKIKVLFKLSLAICTILHPFVVFGVNSFHIN